MLTHRADVTKARNMLSQRPQARIQGEVQHFVEWYCGKHYRGKGKNNGMSYLGPFKI